jgi:hypothetical protein
VSGTLKTYTLNFCRSFTIHEGNQSDTTFVYSTDALGNEVSLTAVGKPAYTETVAQDNNTNDATHILFRQPNGDVCQTDANGDKTYYQVWFQVFCDPNEQCALTSSAISVDESNPCQPKFSLTHKSGCPVFQATSVVQFFSRYPWILGIILIVFGIIVTFWGGKFFPYVLATIISGITFFVVLLLASFFGMLSSLDNNNGKHTGGQIAATVISFLFAIALAVFAGWFIKRARRIGFTLLGAAAGFFGGFLFYSLVFIQWLENTYVLFVICFLCAFAGGFLVYRFDKDIIVFVTAFIGAYALIRGISIFAGHFPNEIALYGQIQSGTFQGLDPVFYGYLAGIVVLGVVGCIFQVKQEYHKHSHYDDEYYKIN